MGERGYKKYRAHRAHGPQVLFFDAVRALVNFVLKLLFDYVGCAILFTCGSSFPVMIKLPETGHKNQLVGLYHCAKRRNNPAPDLHQGQHKKEHMPRPPYEDRALVKKKVHITINDYTKAALKKLGNGNLSIGVSRAIDYVDSLPKDEYIFIQNPNDEI